MNSPQKPGVDVTASPWSASPGLRRRFWIYAAIVLIAAVLVVVDNLVGVALWISALIIVAAILAVTALDVARIRQGMRDARDPPKKA